MRISDWSSDVCSSDLNTMSQGRPGSHNVAIGNSALTYVDKTGGGFNGTRNVGIASLAGHFVSTGYMNTFVGRNSGQCITTGANNTGFGYRALAAGRGPIGLSGLIANNYQVTTYNLTAFGRSEEHTSEQQSKM